MRENEAKIPLLTRALLHTAICSICLAILSQAYYPVAWYSPSYAAAVRFISYYFGTIILAGAGIFALIDVRSLDDFPYYLMIYTGSLLTVWSPFTKLFNTGFDGIVFIGTLGTGNLLISWSISQMTLFTMLAYSAILKTCIISGLLICHVAAAHHLWGYTALAMSIGFGMAGGSYFLGEYVAWKTGIALNRWHRKVYYDEKFNEGP